MTTEEFKAKILPHYKYMYRVAASVMKSEEEAADVVQDAMLRLYERRSQLDEVADAKAYCVNAARNACLNRMRGRKERIAPDDIAEVDSSQDIHAELEWRDMSGLVGRVMNRLPADQLKVFKLSAFGGFSNAEIAETLGITPGNVRVLLSRARNRIKELLSNISSYGSE